MIIQCESCSRKYVVKDIDIPKQGRTVQCGYCSVSWHQMPIIVTVKKNEVNENKNITPNDIKASDGKTYRFLGSQWAQVLSSGKTGIFAKKKIGQELNKKIGRKVEKITTKKKQKINPSLEVIDNSKLLPDIYKPNQGLGFFGYIFLLIISSLSVIGIIKTFESYWLDYFPQHQHFFEYLDIQIEYIVETSKNFFTIFKDLLNSY